MKPVKPMKEVFRSIVFLVVIGFVIYLVLSFIFAVFTLKDHNAQASQVILPEKIDLVFQILADEGRSNTTGRLIWIKNVKTGECYLMARLYTGTALAPALCEKKQ